MNHLVTPGPRPASAAPLSPRRRKLRTTARTLATLAAAGALAWAAVHWINRPKQYAPGEEDPDVTSELARNLPHGAPIPKFTDVTVAAGLASFHNFAGDRTSQLPEDMGPGLAWGDFDNDGDDDLFLVSAGGAMNLTPDKLLPCALYENRGDGSFVHSPRLPELRIHGNGAAWGDFDGDGALDLAVSGYNALHLFRNSGAPEFRLTAVDNFPSPSGFWTGVSWGDYDHDRDLDLYVSGYVKYLEGDLHRGQGSDQLGTFVPYTLNPASYEPGLNMLLRNDGGQFTDVAADLGVTNPAGRSLSALWHDFDDDGWLDLYVANDISDNVFYRNTGGKFEDISHPSWVADYRSAMGLTAGDYNRDGDDDLYITHWVAQENALYENHWADFNENRRLRFTDVNEMRGLGQVALPFVGWGAEFADVDADGWLDLVVANGSTIEEQNSQPRILKPQEPFLFWNSRGEYFHDLAPLAPALRERHVSRGLALSDFDLDGDLDLALAHLGAGVQLLRNEMQTGHWLQIRLRSKNARGEPKGFGDGTKVILHAAGAAHRRTVSSVSYLSQSSRTLHFGLGAATQADRLEVRWLAGGTNYFDNLAADHLYEITEGETTALNVSPARPRDERTVLIEFWKTQRAAMDMLKTENDFARAIPLLRAALRLNPRHEDSHYYLAQCLAAEGQVEAALDQLAQLQRLNSHSHRAFQQWGNLRALSATTREHLAAAQQNLLRARQINPEETGALLILGEVCLLQGELALAESHLADACATNPRAVNGFFLRGYLALERGDTAQAAALLQQTRAALGPEWQPKGATAEGDVKQKLHIESSPLQRFVDHWPGEPEPQRAYAPLKSYLLERRALFGAH